jgi:hypothetical protein
MEEFLQLSVKQFLTGSGSSEDSDEEDEEEGAEYPQHAVCITTKGSILTAARFLIDNHMHRVWVVAPPDFSGLEGFGVGCLSLTDILRTIALLTHSPPLLTEDANPL